MTILLSLILLLIFFVYYISVKKDLSNPGVLYLVIWLVASLGTIYFSGKWGTSLSFVTLIVISLGTIIFLSGISFSNNIIKTRSSTPVYSLPKIPTLFFILTLIFSIITFWVVYKDAYRISIFYSRLSGKAVSRSLFTVIERARYMTTNYDYSFSKGIANLLRANYALGILYFTFFSYEIFYGKSSLFYRFTLFIGAGIALFLSLLSTGRTELLGLFSGYFVIYILYYSKKNIWSNLEKQSKLLKIVFSYGIVSILLFLVVGNFVLNRLENSALDNLAKYIGSPIAGLDYYIKNSHNFADNRHFGENTFIAIYGTLKSLGFTTADISPFLPIISFYGTKSNVYTGYYVYLKDFGYTIALLVQFVYGLFFGSIYFYIKKVRFSPLLIMCFGLLIYGMVIMFFQEAFMTLLTTHITRLIFLFMWYFLVRFLSLFRFKG